MREKKAVRSDFTDAQADMELKCRRSEDKFWRDVSHMHSIAIIRTDHEQHYPLEVRRLNLSSIAVNMWHTIIFFCIAAQL